MLELWLEFNPQTFSTQASQVYGFVLLVAVLWASRFIRRPKK